MRLNRYDKTFDKFRGKTLPKDEFTGLVTGFTIGMFILNNRQRRMLHKAYIRFLLAYPGLTKRQITMLNKELAKI